LLFPDDFERIFGRSDRRKILRAFTALSSAQIAALSPLEIDRELQKVRADQEQRQGTKDLDFYWPPLKALWRPSDDTSSQAPEDEWEGAEAAKRLTRESVIRALGEIQSQGYPPDASSVTYDLIEGRKRYPPKVVFATAIKDVTGQELPRSTFKGGEGTECFRVLRDLGFHIERKSLIQELLQRFLRQADESASLVVQGYPTSYRGLRVNVRFGKGNAARIPWVSFTGFDQNTNDGIYPAVLYYRTQSKVVVAYGISETKAPKLRWQVGAGLKTIEADFRDRKLSPPERYGASYVHSVFDASEQTDLNGLENAIDDVIAGYIEQLSLAQQRGAVVQEPPPPSIKVYGIEEALVGLFIEEQEFRRILTLAKAKKNVILQGPPGVGKTFVCKRLAYALMEEEAPKRLQMVQFHQAYSYEDFVQGFRPSGQGFRLKNGIFYEFCETARNDPANPYVFIIDEINRGNLSKVFGEVMMLLESDKRGPEWEMPLAYSESGAERFYVPSNVYLIGLMNTADRSLAMVDYALRRRFAFVDLKPAFDTEEFREYLEGNGADRQFIEALIQRMSALNQTIAADGANLGPGFCIGHSFFCSIPHGLKPDWTWFKGVIEGEIGPLLREYYFDNVKQVTVMLEDLLKQD